eukprot:1195956-Prorocentrum_minimum.AAC.5
MRTTILSTHVSVFVIRCVFVLGVDGDTRRLEVEIGGEGIAPDGQQDRVVHLLHIVTKVGVRVGHLHLAALHLRVAPGQTTGPIAGEYSRGRSGDVFSLNDTDIFEPFLSHSTTGELERKLLPKSVCGKRSSGGSAGADFWEKETRKKQKPDARAGSRPGPAPPSPSRVSLPGENRKNKTLQ